MAIARTAATTSPVTSTTQATAPTPRGVSATGGPQIKNHGDIGYDREIVESGDLARAAERVGHVYTNRGFDAPDQAEIDRLAAAIIAGDSTFAALRQQVDSYLGSDSWTRASLGEAGDMPIVLPGLSAADIADLMAQRRAATANYEAAQDAARLAKGDAQRQFALQAEERRLMFEQALGQMMGQLGDRGMAFQPRGAGKGRRQLSDAESRQAQYAQLEHDRRLAEIAASVAAARRARDQQIAQLEAEEVRRKAALQQEYLRSLQF